MTTTEEKMNKSEDIQLLTFNVMGVKIGMDMEQIDEMLLPDQVKIKELEVFLFHEKLSFRKEAAAYRSPRLLLLKENNVTTGVIIDQPEDIIPLSIDAIQPLPPLMDAGNISSPIWGVTLKDEEIVLLVDFYKLLACKTIIK